MSQSITTDPLPRNDTATFSTTHARPYDDFSYTPVTPLAPIACFLGVASTLNLLTFAGIPIAAAGFILGLIGLRKIRTSDGAIGGKVLATIGTILAFTFLVVGVARESHAYATECPEDHVRVNFPRDISAKQFVMKDQKRFLHPDVEPLIGQKVFLKGFMYQAMQTDRLQQFVLLKDNGECCFGGQPQPYDMIGVTMAGDLTTRSYNQMIYVTGVLSANPDAPMGAPVYTIEATSVGRPKSTF